MADNRVVLTGRVLGPIDHRVTPAGIPISRFTLDHRSLQSEAGMRREAVLRLQVVASGDGLAEVARGLKDGSAVSVEGFLARSSYRQGEHRISLHAQGIETIEPED